MPAAIIGAGIGAVGSVVSAKSAKKAAKRASTAIQQTAATNNALAGDIYTQDRAMLGAYAQPGNPAGTQLNALLGLGSPSPATAPANPLATPGQPAQPTAQGFDAFRNSTGYEFRLGEGMRALNSGYAGSGLLQSGAALRGAQEFGQNFASNEFSNYTNLLDNQQRVGLAGATTQAGLGQNYVGTVSANNMQAGDAQANAALIRAQNNPFAAIAGSLSGSLLSGGLKF